MDMTDTTFALVTFGSAACVWASRYLLIALRERRGLAGIRIVTCPETGRAAAVSFNRVHAALTALAHNEPDLQLADCSRWAVRGPCDQACVPQAKLPESTATNMVVRWSAGKRCALCGKPLIEASRVDHHIGLLSSDRVTTEWPGVPPEELPEALRTRRPVCWNCHIAEMFRRLRPELVTDR
jgi:hypothetical protein